MKDPRIQRIAELLVNHSIKVQPNEHVLVQTNTEIEISVVREIINEIHKVGGFAHVDLNDSVVTRQLVLGGGNEQFKVLAELEVNRLAKMDGYINLRSPVNSSEFVDIPDEKFDMYAKIYGTAQSEAIFKKKWVTTRIPNPSMAQEAKMSTEAFEDFYFDICNVDYKKLSEAMDPLKELMEKTKFVEIKGPRTDLSMSIENMGVIKGDGIDNIPDGEIYTAPIRDSVNGTITFNTPAHAMGVTFENLSLTFEKGKVVKATANYQEKLNEMLNTDDGARYVGEFALAFNPKVKVPMNNTLFDEKIDGSFHIALGYCFEEADNGNKSAIHWDLISIQRPDYGGGEIYFDGQLIRKDGRFVIPELEGLNPEKILAE
ncbi:aminopeptidase [Psychrobacillus glaciei]|uniref:aminopeptidase n=1 Tax=Psychrobacillus glaciei TaxID=2283160 RepID=UPI00178C486E|nr:aminopeptidase [Psychrobacillus glaciei]